MPEEIPHEAQVTPAHVLAVINEEIVPRLKAVESTANQSYQILKAAGILNGKGDELIQIVRDFRRNNAVAQAWRVVWSDLAHRLRWLLPGRHWIALVLAGALGAVGWQIGAAAFGIHISLP